MRCIHEHIKRLRHELDWRGHSLYSRDNWNTPSAQKTFDKVRELRNKVKALQALTKD